MPKIEQPKVWGRERDRLYNLGVFHVARFCEKNDLPSPVISSVPPSDWNWGACAFYRPSYINICLGECATPATEAQVRNWNWPGSTVDREPFGVLCHELGHHCDWLKGIRKGRYYSEFCEVTMARSGEAPISSYSPNPAEWFAEMFRVFVTNHALLRELRPKTYDLLRNSWTPITGNDWRAELGADVPSRIVRSLERKGAK